MRKKALALVLCLAMVLSIIPALTMEANAAESSSVVSGELKQYISAISTSGGTTRLSVDNLRGNLNRKSSKAADYWLYADFTSNADEAITGIWIMGSDSLTTIDKYAVTRASDNVNSEGRACYIYYTKDKNAGAPIASVGVWQSEDDYFEYVTNVGEELQEYYNTGFDDKYSDYGYTPVSGDHTDLNAGAGSKTAYVYLYYKRAPYVKTQTAEFCYDGQAHNGSVTVSDGAVVTYGTGVSAIGSHTQTFKVTQEGMLPISGTTPVVISNHDYSVSLNNKVDTSCKAAGHETDMKCSKCGAVKAGAVIPKLDHTYKNVICTVCGAIEEGWTQIPKSQTYYKIDGDTLYIDGKGDIPNNAFKQKLSTSIVLDGVTKAVIGDAITGIGLGAFQACKSLTSVTIPNSVKSIGPSAFIGCSALTSVTIPNSVTSIGGNAFAACTSLTSITIPNSVTSIGEGAFLQCSKLTSITIPGSVKSPAANIFSKCTNLKTVVIENGVTSISDYMFNACYALNSVTIPNTVTSIGIQAFYGTSLTSVTIPNSVTSLASNAFYGCSKLNQATLPCRLNYSFASGVRVTKVHVGDAVTDASKAPTCTENGLTEGTHCSVCGAVLTAQEVITAAGHIWGSWNVWQEPSCTEPGIRGRLCERCHAEETEEIPTTDHYWGSWNVWEEPSCTEPGTRGRFCERCHAEETEEIPMTDHYWGSWNVWEEPTCTTAGIRGRTCQRCYQSEQEPIDTLAHEWQDGYCTRCGEACKHDLLTSADCTHAPFCLVCHEYVGEALGHTFENGVCTECGFAQFEFNSASLVLSGELVMDINCTVNDMEAVKDGYMEMTVGSTSTQKVSLSDAAHNADGTYSFPCCLNVLQMADDITLSFHYGDTVVGPYTKSVAQYLNNIKSKYGDNAELVALAEAIADYGHFAQPALQEANGFEDGKYQTMNRISNAAFTLPDAADLAGYKATKTGSVAQITNVSRALALDHGTDILLYLTCTGGYTPSITVTDKDGNEVTIAITEKNGKQIVTIPQTSAHKLGDFYTVRIDNGAMEIKISALSYAYSVLKSATASDAQKDAVAALYYYYQATIAYQTAKN